MATKFNQMDAVGNPYTDKLTELLQDEGFNFTTGVPCGVLRHFIRNFETSSIHLPGQSEPESIGLAVGAYLASKKPILYMQNSGLLKSTNEIGSLMLPCKSPSVFFVAYRGCEGEDAPQHLITGGITKRVLESLNIPYWELEEENIETVFKDSMAAFYSGRPAVVLVKRGWTTSKKRIAIKEEKKTFETFPLEEVLNLSRLNARMKREEALDTIMSVTSQNQAHFSTTGLISRSIFERYDSANQFYNTGSFGMVSSLGLGFAISKPGTKTIVIDGDASLLTNFGTLVTIGHHKPKNLVHIVLDNNAYASCTEETSCSNSAHLAHVAIFQGYEKAIIVDHKCGLAAAIREGLSSEGPTFIQAKIKLGGRRDFKRPIDLAWMAHRFKEHFE